MNKNQCHVRLKYFGKPSRGLFVFLPHMLTEKEKKCKFCYCDSTEWFISADRLQEIEKNETFPASVRHTRDTILLNLEKFNRACIAWLLEIFKTL